MIKIYVVPIFSTTERQSGVDYARLTLPMSELAKQKGFKVDIFDIKNQEKRDWTQIIPEYDFVYFNYTPNAYGFAAMGCMVRKFGKKMIMDLDDNIWKILPDNFSYNAWMGNPQTLKDFTAIANEVDYMTTTNGYLRNVILSKTDKKLEEVGVFPNRIDMDSVYTWRKPFKDTPEINIGHYGSSTHFQSLLESEFVEGLDRLMSDYPNVNFITIGSMIGRHRERWGRRYIDRKGDQDLMTWIKKSRVETLADIDFMAVPLTDNTYNRCKSSIKYIECSSAKVPGCYQNIRQYSEVIKDGENGFLCKTADDWYNKMKKLIDDKVLRQQMGENAFKTVKDKWQIKDNMKEYIDFFKRIK